MATTRPYEHTPQATTSTGHAALRLARAGGKETTVRLQPERAYTLGRAGDADLVFPAETVSRYHAMVSVEGGSWSVRDLASENGCFDAQGKRISRQTRLVAGDRVFLGRPTDGNWLELTQAEPTEQVREGTTSSATRALESFVAVSARHQLSIVLLGSSGSGKSWLARHIHERSGVPGQFSAMNCGALPNDTASVHSELLGHVRGAFTGAHSARIGRVQFAEGGTLFLDEVEAMPRLAQDFLIDVLDRRSELAPYGAAPSERRPLPRFRLISASKVPLARSPLRRDLVQRLAVGDVFALPTLEQRRADIPVFVAAFLADLRATTGLDASFSPSALKHLQTQPYPGELRELRATVEAVVHRAVASSSTTGPVRVGLDEVTDYLARRRAVMGDVDEPAAPSRRPASWSAEELAATLAKHQGNKTHTAKALAMSLNTLKSLLRRHGLS